ncbi:MAG: hypothetical protein WC356_01855 [Candidatus Micrarchaeia archaeon]
MGHKLSGTVTTKYPKGVVLVTDSHLLWWFDKEDILEIGDKVENQGALVLSEKQDPVFKTDHLAYCPCRKDNEQLDNARLIAAAPELLATLKSLLSDETTVNCLAATGKLKEVQAAISSAESED